MPNRWFSVPLLFLLPLIWIAARWLARKATADARLSRLIAPGVALASWLFAIHIFGLLAHSFYFGLYAGTLVLAALGAWCLGDGLPPASAEERASRWIWVTMAASGCLLVGPVMWSKHDECLLVGHVSIPSEMLNGIYPPRHLTFAAYELRYHYGADLAVACVSAVLGRPEVQTTVHVLAVLLFAYTTGLYWLVGERLIGRRAAGPVTAACVMLAGGGPFLPQPGHPFWDSVRIRAGTWMTPPMISNFVQHPWSLGLPFFAILLLVWMRLQGALPARWAWLLLAIVAATLSLSQATLFICVVPAFVAVGSLEGRRPSLARLWRWGAWATGVFVTARLMHGFLAPVAEPALGRLEFHPFWGDTTPREFLLWHLEGLGTVMLLGGAGFLFLRRERLLLGLLAAGGLIVRELFKYWPGWNIVKFSVVSQLALALAAAALLTAALTRRRWWPAGVVGLGAITFVSLAFSASLTFVLPKGSCLPNPSPADSAAIEFIRRRIAAGESVYRSEGAEAYAYALRGGLPQPTWDWGVKAFGFSDALYKTREGTIIQHPEDLEAQRAQGFRWLVLAPRDTKALEAARRWAGEGRAELAAEIPPLTVFHLL